MKLLSRLIFGLTFMFWASYSLSRPLLVSANSAGINIGTNYGHLEDAVGTVGPGGWIVLIAGGTGDCKEIEKATAKNINLVIRGHLNNNLTPQDAIAWAATLGKINTQGKKIYFMPWNEPNQMGSGDYAPASTVQAYTDALFTHLDASTVHSKVDLLSPMINRTHPNFSDYISGFSGGYFARFDGIASNLYDICGSASCPTNWSSNPNINAYLWPGILDKLGAPGKRMFGVEAGTAGDIFYWRTAPTSSSPLFHFVDQIFGSPPTMIGIPSYDLGGEVGHNWQLMPSDTANLLGQKGRAQGGSTTPAGFDQTAFDNWLKPLVDSGELVPCANACGYAHKSNPGLCNGTGGFGESQLPQECNPNNPGDQNSSRPVSCEACNQTTNLTNSCATSFTVKDVVQYQQDEGNLCQAQYWVEKNWEGTITVDPSTAELPFAGKKGQENRSRYLADYFEGTCPWYTGQPCPEGASTQTDTGISPVGLTAMMPEDMQDGYKENMVRRALQSKVGSLFEGGIHDYLVIFPNPANPTHSFTARLSEFITHLKPQKYPDETDSDYYIRLKTWQASDGGKWSTLWADVPMFTREDTLGKIVPYVGTQIKDQTSFDDIKDTIDRVPHLARLYETTKALRQFFLPAGVVNGTASLPSNEKTAQTTNKSTYLLASTDPTSLLAEAPCPNCIVPQIVDPHYEGGVIKYTLSICPSCSGYGTIGDVYMGPFNQVHNVPPSCFSSDNEAVAPPVAAVCPGITTITTSARANRDVADSCRGQTITTSCRITLDASCKITATTCGALPPPAPACGLPPARSVEQCKDMAIFSNRDAKDKLCCNPIKLKLKATDQFVNTHYSPCGQTLMHCEADPSTPCGWNNCSGCQNDPNFTWMSGTECETYDQDVQRNVGVALSHPYLQDIWEFTAAPKTGFFNMFRPPDVPAFTPDAAATTINYSFAGSPKGSIDPSSGTFYYPYLGGVEKAKRKMSSFFTVNPPGDKSDDGLTPGQCPSSADIGFTFKANDPSVSILPTRKQEIINLVKDRFPASPIGTPMKGNYSPTDKPTSFDYIYDAAIANNWNPALVISLWIEESGASGMDAYDFGCYAAEPNNIDDGLNCLFKKIAYVDQSAETFMCYFAEGEPAPCSFCIACNFPKNLKAWYQYATSVGAVPNY